MPGVPTGANQRREQTPLIGRVFVVIAVRSRSEQEVSPLLLNR